MSAAYVRKFPSVRDAAGGWYLNPLETKLPEANIIPAERPDLPVLKEPCWFNAQHEVFFWNRFPADLRLYVELGSFLGASAGYVLKTWPRAAVIAIDHFAGSAEHVSSPSIAAILPQLFEHFCVNLWDYKDRLFPLRMSTIEGLKLLAERQIIPDVMYVDAAHDTESVLADVVLAATLFPDTFIFGDDWGGWPTVRDGAIKAAVKLGREVANNGHIWWLE